MRRLVGCLAVGLVTVILAAASVAQDYPPSPPFDANWHGSLLRALELELCLERKGPLPNGDPGVQGLRLNRADNPWLPPLDTPIQQFTSPFGWTWRPDPVYDAWLATSPNPFPLNQELCFGHPVTRKLTAGQVERIIAEAANRRDVYFFTSQQVLPKPRRGALPMVFTLPQQDITATFTSPSSACGLVRNFTTGLRMGARNNLVTAVEPRTGDTVKGKVNPRTMTFRLTGATEVYVGGITNTQWWATYAYTRIFGGQPCTAGYLARLDLIRQGRLIAACKRPKIVAPRTVVVRSGPFRIRVAASCAGQYVAGLKLTASLRLGTEVRRLGSFTTKAKPAPVTIRPLFKREEQNPPRPKERVYFEFRSPTQMGLGPAVTLVEILFPER